MGRILADLGQHAPAASAFGAGRQRDWQRRPVVAAFFSKFDCGDDGEFGPDFKVQHVAKAGGIRNAGPLATMIRSACPRARFPATKLLSRAIRGFRPLAASASSRHSAGTSGKTCKWTLPSSPKRAPQASSAVNTKVGASQVHRQRCSASSTVLAARRRRLSGAVAVDRVLAHVEVERREVARAERMDLRQHPVQSWLATAPRTRLSSSRETANQVIQNTAYC